MRHIFTVYFGQDFDLFGDTVPEIVSCYRRDESHRREDLIREIGSFIGEHPKDLDAAFERDYGSAFDPESWGHTTASFLDELKRLLSE
ncbi:contact-dependent growth inhibition system immunity protein [Paraburkholderia sp.]|uniref:contact-dependent growth inhibition system immunity protein n=1 Tax=Paraburkholderia sp. TaxID=1926495 RepID=UPI0039E2423D